MLIRRKEATARASSLRSALVETSSAEARSPLVPRPLGSRCRRRRRDRRARRCRREEGRGRPGQARREDRAQEEHLHALLGRLHGDRRGAGRRVGRPGAGVGIADQPRHALRQGRGDPRDRARRPPPQVSDEARGRAVEAHQVGRGADRDRPEDDGDPREVGAGFGVVARLAPSSPTRAPTCSASSRRSGAPTRSTIRRASATRPRSPASPTPGATARRPTPTTTSATPRPPSSWAATRPRRIRSRCSTCCRARSSTAPT